MGPRSEWLHEVAAKAKALVVGAGHEAKTDIGPLISPAAKARVEDLIQSAIDEGANVILDGRNAKVHGFPSVSWTVRMVVLCQQSCETPIRCCEPSPDTLVVG